MHCLRKAAYHLAPVQMQSAMQVLPPARSRQGRTCLRGRCFQLFPLKTYTLWKPFLPKSKCAAKKPKNLQPERPGGLYRFTKSFKAAGRETVLNAKAWLSNASIFHQTYPRLLGCQWPFIQQALADRFAEWRQKLPEDVLSRATAIGAATVC